MGGVQQQTAPDSYPITSSIADGDVGSACTTDTGAYGIRDINKVCQVGRGAGSSNTTMFCQYRSVGTLCTPSDQTRTGVCRRASNGINECVVAKEKDFCIDTLGRNSSIDQFGKCVFGTADGRTAPQAGQEGSSCSLNGQNGMISDGVCVLGGRR